MRRAVTLLALVAVFFAACSKEQDPHKLVADADALLVNGGIENSKTRALAEQKYDRAIRIICGENAFYCVKSGSGSAPGTNDHSLAHAHFGLAFTRSFDLVERIKQLYESGTILRPRELGIGDGQSDDDGGVLGDTTDDATATPTENACQQQLNLPQLVPLLKTIVDTSLLPIVRDLQSVTNYPEFSIAYQKAFLDFGFLNTDAEDPLGIDFGADDAGMLGKFTVTEAYAALAVFRTLTMGAEGVFSFNDLTQALIVFLPKIDLSSGVRPWEFSKLLNNDQCTPNPLFDASFGVLTEAGRETFSDIEEQLGALFTEQETGFQTIFTNKDREALFDFKAKGQPWATNMAKRIRTGKSLDDRNIENLVTIITALLSPDELSKAFNALNKSLTTGKTFDLAAFVDDNAELKSLLDASDVDLRTLGIPALNFKRFFANPISDLKSIAPLTYAEGEPVKYEVVEKPGYFKVLEQETPVGDEGKTMFFNDVNGDRHLNVRGDFIVQIEREAFYDEFNDDAPLQHPENQGLDAGVIGAFWDADFNGFPDAGFEGVIPGTGANAVTSVAGVLTYAAVTQSTEKETYRDYFDANQVDSNGCLDDLPVKPTDKNKGTRETCTVELGGVLGHVWPSIYPEDYAAPATLDARSKDPANGVVDQVYMFFPNPSLNGAFEIAQDDGKYRPFSNGDLNRFVSGVLSFGDVANRIANKK